MNVAQLLELLEDARRCADFETLDWPGTVLLISGFHVKISKAKNDPYAAPRSPINSPCGCEVQPCGFVVPKETCQYHSERRPQTKQKMFAHLASNCPG